MVDLIGFGEGNVGILSCDSIGYALWVWLYAFLVFMLLWGGTFVHVEVGLVLLLCVLACQDISQSIPVWHTSIIPLYLTTLQMKFLMLTRTAHWFHNPLKQEPLAKTSQRKGFWTVTEKNKLVFRRWGGGKACWQLDLREDYRMWKICILATYLLFWFKILGKCLRVSEIANSCGYLEQFEEIIKG